MLWSELSKDGAQVSENSRIEALVSVVEGSLLSGLVNRGESILVACSGGADSTFLLDVMNTLRRRHKWRIGAVYVNHHQYEGSEKIAKILRTICSGLKVPFWSLSLSSARVPRGSSEALLRDERYTLLSKFAQHNEFDRVAMAHTASDQAETILMRVLRGTSTRGLRGIPSCRDSLFVRPMLKLHREEIIDYLRLRRLHWHEDPTNQDRSFLRNYIRHELLPMVRKRINPEVDNALLRLSESASMDQDALEGLASKVHIRTGNGNWAEVNFETLEKLPDAVRARVIILMVRSLEGNSANLEQQHVSELLAKLRQNKRFRLELQGGLEAYFSIDKLLVRRKRINVSPFSLQVEKPGEFILPGKRGKVIVRTREKWDYGLATANRVFFDAKSVSFPFLLRTVEQGDRISPWGMAGRKKVLRLLRDHGLCEEQKKMVVVMEVNKEILWILGIRRSSLAKAEKNSRKVLEIVFVSDTAA